MLIGEKLQLCLQQRQRRAQFMGGVADELPAASAVSSMGAADAEGAAALDASCFAGASMRRGLRSFSSMSWRKIFPLRAPGGWRMITAISSALPAVWLLTTTFRFWTWRSILRIAARALRASCSRT